MERLSVQERGKESTLSKKVEKQVGYTEQRSGNTISILTGWLSMTDVTKRRRHVGISSGLADRLGADCTHGGGGTEARSRATSVERGA